MSEWKFGIHLIACAVPLFATIGCGGIDSVVVDPVEASTAALEQYDKNGDGLLDETELKACPALLMEFKSYDESNDEKLSAEEIGAEITEMYGRGGGMSSMSCNVTMDSSPLSGATVKFVPEPFLGGKIPLAEGVTNSSGSATIGIAPDELPKQLRRHSLMRAGIYRVEITHPTRKIPPRYNTETQLGFAFHNIGHLRYPEFHLLSRETKGNARQPTQPDDRHPRVRLADEEE
jgi:hypothetical protein